MDNYEYVYNLLPKKEKWDEYYDEDGYKHFTFQIFKGGPEINVTVVDNNVRITMIAIYADETPVMVRFQLSMEQLNYIDNSGIFGADYFINNALESLFTELLSKRLNDDYKSIHIPGQDTTKN